MKLWPKSKVAQIVIIGVGLFLIIGFTCASILAVAAVNYANRPVFDTRDYERKYRARTPFPLLFSLLTVPPTEDNLISIFQVEMSIMQGLEACSTREYTKAADHLNQGHDLALRKLGPQSKLTQWVSEIRCETDISADNYSEAIKHYREFVKEILSQSKTGPAGLSDMEREDYFYILVQTASALDSASQYPEAIRMLKDEVLPLAQKIDGDNPDKPNTFYATMQLGYTQHHGYKYVDAIASFDIVKNLLQSRHASNRDLACVYLWLGASKARNKQYAASIADLDTAITLDKTDYRLFEHRAYAYEDLKNYPAAIKDMTTVLDLVHGKRQSEYLERRAYFYASNKQNDLALADMAKAIELQPSKTAPDHRRISILKKIGKTEEAIDEYIKAIAAKPDDPNLYVDRALTESDLNQHAKAAVDYQKAIDLCEKANSNSETKNKNPQFSLNLHPIYHNLAQSYLSSGKPEEALTAVNRGIKISPWHAGLYTLRTDILKKLGKPYDIKTVCKDLFAANPTKIFPYKVRAQVYRDAKDYSRAVADYSTAIELAKKRYPHMQTQMNNIQAFEYCDCYWGRAACYRSLGKIDLALKDEEAGKDFQKSIIKYEQKQIQ